VNAVGVAVGRITPALLLGLGTVLMRSSIAAGASIPSYLAVVGTTIKNFEWILTTVKRRQVLIDKDPIATDDQNGLTDSFGGNCGSLRAGWHPRLIRRNPKRFPEDFLDTRPPVDFL